MPKNAVFPYMMFTQFIDEPKLKKLSLFFDHIYISEPSLNYILTTNPKPSSEYAEALLYEKAVWEFLLENEIVKAYPFIPNKFEATLEDGEASYLTAKFKSLMPQAGAKANIDEMSNEEKEKIRLKFLEHHFLTHDVMIRMDALQLRKNTEKEFFPILRANTSFQTQEKKSGVIQFLLNDIPEPEISTPWEKIIEFRTDDNLKNKYLALINWINKAANSSSSLSDLKDEYEYLYSDYLKHFKLHKLKYNNTLLEVIVTAGAGMLLALQTGAFVPAFKNLLQMNLSHIKLMEEEGKLPGKEIAYIYHLKQHLEKR